MPGLFADTHKRELKRLDDECRAQRMRIDFDGHTFDAGYDLDRLTTQLGKVYRAMRAGDWMTLRELQDRVGGSEAGISARLRDLRKSKWGSHTVERRRRGEAKAGVWEYRLDANINR